MNRKLLFLIVGLFIAVAVLLPAASGTKTNCGGNSAALARAHEIALAAAVGALDTPDHSFRFAANAKEHKEFAYCAYSHWLPRAHFLVSNAPISASQPKHIIVVCDTPYRNIPQRWIGSAPPTHAAGYSDGSYGLISLAEFAAIDKSTFVALDKLYPPKPE